VRVLVTGSRNWPSSNAVWQALTALYEGAGEPLTVVHGDCPTGADKAASEWVRELRQGIEEKHPADWKKDGRAAGPIRNAEMVAKGADVCLAFLGSCVKPGCTWAEIGHTSHGASDCAVKAMAAGIDTRIWRL
jgi:hypothetical protein